MLSDDATGNINAVLHAIYSVRATAVILDVLPR